MRKAKYSSLLKDALEQKIHWKFFALVAVVSNLILAMAVFTSDKTEKTIILPPNISRPFWVKGAEVSPSYMEDMARHFVGMIKTYQSSNARYQFDQIVKFAHPLFAQQFKSMLDYEADRIERLSLGSVFYLTGIEIKKNICRVKGELIGSIGQQWQPRKDKLYEMGFSYENGVFYIKSFAELLVDAAGETSKKAVEDTTLINAVDIKEQEAQEASQSSSPTLSDDSLNDVTNGVKHEESK